MLRRIIIFTFYIVTASNSYAGPELNDDQRNTRFDENCNSDLMLGEIKGEFEKDQTHALDFYVYPKEVGSSFTGCQTVWLANGHKLLTRHFSGGELTWVRGQEPKEIIPYFCLYEEGELLTSKSFNLKRCPVSNRQ